MLGIWHHNYDKIDISSPPSRTQWTDELVPAFLTEASKVANQESGPTLGVDLQITSGGSSSPTQGS